MRAAGTKLLSIIQYLNQKNYNTLVIDSKGNLRGIHFPFMEVINSQTKNFISFPSISK